MARLALALLVTLVVLQVSYHTVESSCITSVRNYFSCAGRAMRAQYNAMKSANCRNCDKYFHCKGNYNAVYNCGGSRSKNRRVAEAISNCREWLQGSDSGSGSDDSRADQAANRYGRNGGNCERRYLCSNRCSWSPSRRTCRASNC